MAKKFYAVRKGRQAGIYNTWEECQKQINGFSGAEYKSFLTLDEANQFLVGNTQVKRDPILEKDIAIAYVDGSYNATTKEYSYGAVLIINGKQLEFSEKGEDVSLADMRNVAGEILGAEKMMQYCVDHEIKQLDIYYDYEGIEKWCTKVWQAKKKGTQAYAAFYDSIKDKLYVNFNKVAAHTGVELNERVDKLAKQALGIEG